MEIIVGIIVVVSFVFLIRMFGAWMLRIDEVIDIQKQILNQLKNNNSKHKKIEYSDNDDENIEIDSDLINSLNKVNLLKK